MIIGERIRALREQKGFSQGDIEKRSSLLRCYISRVENGHTVPSLETLEKFAQAIGVPLHELFYEGNEPPALAEVNTEEIVVAPKGNAIQRLASLFGQLSDRDQQLLLHTAERLSKL